MRFLIDENVPLSVTQLLAKAGHEVIHALDLFMPGEKDEVLAAVADREEAIIVTWNRRDFRKLASRRAPRGTQGKLRRLGCITFRCKEPRGRDRLAANLGLIEFEHKRAQFLSDKRVFIDIYANFVKIHR